VDTLFRMRQTLKEMLNLGDASFKISMKDGTIKTFKTLDEMDEFFRREYE
jgi:uncharacterized protein (UPF0216 family)